MVDEEATESEKRFAELELFNKLMFDLIQRA